MIMAVLFVFFILVSAVLSYALIGGTIILTICGFHTGIFTGIGVLLGCLFVVALYITVVGNYIFYRFRI